MNRQKLPAHNPLPLPEIVGKCPECGRDVMAGRKQFCCVGVHDGSCSFQIFRDYFRRWGEKRPISVNGMRRLLQGGVIPLHGLVSQKGARFDCYGILNWLDDYDRWGIRFVWPA